MKASNLFDPVDLGPLRLANRWAVAPMTRVSATAEGRATPRMARYYADFAAGGFGLVITEGVYTDRAYSQGYLFQPGLADDAQRDAWRPVVEGVHAAGGRIVAQLMHAGAISQGNAHRAVAKGPSAVQPAGVQMSFYRGEGPYRMPEAMTLAEITAAIDGFAAAALRACRWRSSTGRCFRRSPIWRTPTSDGPGPHEPEIARKTLPAGRVIGAVIENPAAQDAQARPGPAAQPLDIRPLAQIATPRLAWNGPLDASRG
jgi:hypothetical protein